MNAAYKELTRQISPEQNNYPDISELSAAESDALKQAAAREVALRMRAKGLITYLESRVKEK